MAPTIEEIMQKVAAAFVPQNAHDIDAVVHFKFTGLDAGEWNAVIRDGTCQVAQGLPRSRPTVSLTADSADFVRIATGELDGMKAFMDGRLKLEGDTVLLPKLIHLFQPD